MDCISLKLCDIQARLFELSSRKGYDSASFVSFFMKSDVARSLDSVYNRMQWAGEEYLLEEVIDSSRGRIQLSGNPASPEVMYWIGYIYRYWHYYRNEESARIYRQADFTTMKRNYLIFHTMDPSLAVDDLIEMGREKR